jgi:hypothetical protein
VVVLGLDDLASSSRHSYAEAFKEARNACTGLTSFVRSRLCQTSHDGCRRERGHGDTKAALKPRHPLPSAFRSDLSGSTVGRPADQK